MITATKISKENIVTQHKAKNINVFNINNSIFLLECSATNGKNDVCNKQGNIQEEIYRKFTLKINCLPHK